MPCHATPYHTTPYTISYHTICLLDQLYPDQHRNPAPCLTTDCLAAQCFDSPSIHHWFCSVHGTHMVVSDFPIKATLLDLRAWVSFNALEMWIGLDLSMCKLGKLDKYLVQKCLSDCVTQDCHNNCHFVSMTLLLHCVWPLLKLDFVCRRSCGRTDTTDAAC